MAEEISQHPPFYHLHNAVGMACALHRYAALNSQAEAAGIEVRYGPPADRGKVLTGDVYVRSATGIYVPCNRFPQGSEPVLSLEDALAQLYAERGIPVK